MTRPIERALIRIYTLGGIAGVGFLLDPNHASTCWHVIERAQSKDDTLTVDFPFLAPGKHLLARVEKADQVQDVAVLRLEGELPAGVEPLRLVTPRETWGHPFRAFGFPAGHDSGVWAKGVLRAPIGDIGWLQIEDAHQTGYFVQPGFSGAPVWDEEADGVVGMVMAAERDPGIRAAFCILAEQLIAFWPEWQEHAILPNPYRGLLAFREQDAPFFFGRETFIDRLVAAVEGEAPLVAVIGPSGSGKSSVVFAGLLPRLRPWPDWAIITLRPGGHPFEAIAEAALPLLEPETTETDRLREVPKLAASLRAGEIGPDRLVRRILEKQGKEHLLMVVDQFEELYTLCDEENRRTFLDRLIEAASLVAPLHHPSLAPLRLVLTLRADFLSQALAYRPFADLLDRAGWMLLGPMSREELEAAVVRPAEKQGIAFEEGLVARILDDVGEEPGNLPLLEFALTQLWEQQERGVLTHRAYETIGGVEGALVRYADRVYEELDEAEQERAREVFIQLVHPGEGTEDTRRRATRKELGEARWALVQRLADARLVVTDRSPTGQEVVEVTHEALIRYWGRPQEWMAKNREFRLWQERMRSLCRQWEESGKDEGALLRGALLAQAVEWLERRGGEVEDNLRTFIRTSQERAEAERVATERRRRWSTLVAVGAAVVLLILALLALGQRNVALEAQATSEEHRRIAKARQLAAQAQYMSRLPRSNTERIIAPLLAMEVLRHTPSVEAHDVLQQVLFNRLPLRVIYHRGPVYDVAFSLDGRFLGTASADGTARLVEVTTGRELARIQHEGRVSNVVFSPDGRFLASASWDGTAALVEVTTGRELTRVRHGSDVSTIVFSPDSRFLATAGSVDGVVALWEVTTGRELTRIRHGGGVSKVVFSPDGRFLVTASWEGTVRLVKVSGNRELVRSQDERKVNEVAISPDGRFLAVASNDGVVTLVEASTGHELTHVQHKDKVNKLAFSPDSRFLATGGYDGTVVLVEVPTGRTVGSVKHEEWIRELIFSPDGRFLATLSNDNIVALVEAPTGRELARVQHEDTVWKVTFSSDSRFLATAGNDGTAILLEIVTGREQARIHHNGVVVDIAFSPDGHFLATASSSGTAVLIETATGHELTRIQHEGGVWDVTFSSDSRYLVTASDSGTVSLIEVITGRELSRIQHEACRLGSSLGLCVESVFSPDNRFLATAGNDGTVVLVETATGRELTHIQHEGRVWDITFSPDSRYLATAGVDGIVALVEMTAVRKQFRIQHEESVDKALFSPGGRFLAIRKDEKTVVLMEIPTGRELTRVQHEDTVERIVFSPSSRFLATVNGDGTVALVDIVTGRELARVHHEGVVWEVAFSPDGRYLATASGDNTVALVETATGHELTRIYHEGGVSSIAFTLDSRFLATASWDGTATVMELPTSQERVRIHHEGGVIDITFSPDGRFLATAGWDGTVALVEVATGRELARIHHEACTIGRLGPCLQVVFSPNGRFLATASRDGTAVLVEVTTGRKLARIHHEDWVGELIFSPNSRFLVTAGLDDSIVLIEVPTGRELVRTRYRVCIASFYSELQCLHLYFTSDGRFLAIASWDGIAALFDVTLRQEIARIRHQGAVLDVTFSPDGRYLFTAGEDNVYILPLDTEDFFNKVCARLSRNLTREEWIRYLGPEEPYHPTCPNLPVPEEYSEW